MTKAVTEAVRERLDRVKKKGMAERIMKSAKESSALLKGNLFPITVNCFTTRKACLSDRGQLSHRRYSQRRA
jgi:hypothetical protein